MAIGCPKSADKSKNSLVEKDRQDAIDELIFSEDDEFEGIPESNEQEDEEIESEVDDDNFCIPVKFLEEVG